MIIYFLITPMFSLRAVFEIMYFLLICLFGYLILFGRTLAFASKRLKLENVTFKKCLIISLVSVCTSLILMSLTIQLISLLFMYYITGPLEPSLAWMITCPIVAFLVLSATQLLSITIFTSRLFNLERKKAFRLSLLTVLMNYILGLGALGIIFSISSL